MRKLDGLKPERVFYYFEEIAGIPHGSKNTDEISKYLCDFAQNHSLKFYRDSADNVVIYKAASAGYENADPVMLQGHMDMVCEKEDGADFDFEKDGLRLLVDGDNVTADGTTLGGDDGIAVAMILAILEDESLKHPAIEAVITSDEEIGLLGAKAFDASKVSSKLLINIDSEGEGVFLTSCAGGADVESVIPLEYKKNDKECFEICVKGLEGGHSGSEIDKERGNAISLLGRVLGMLSDEVSFDLCNLFGGQKTNAIPRKALAYVAVFNEDEDALCKKIDEIDAVLRNEFKTADGGIRVCVSAADMCEKAFSPASKARVLSFLRLLPQGVVNYSKDIEGLVETSLNPGIMTCDEESFVMKTSVRSSVESRKKEICDKIKVLTVLLGGQTRLYGEYPGWEYNPDSKLRGIFGDAYKELFQKEARFEAIHAGLECGLFAGMIDGLDAIALGPDLWDIHTPGETLSVSSTERTYNLVCSVLEKLK
ncbi:MAG: aminoacyl-histidine dipeptidase [Eubacterium sp.]|nr:aminoacyl-histidine dipeptidase [Eubacterium sp.]